MSLVVRAPITREHHEIEHIVSGLLLENETLRKFGLEVREVAVGKFTAELADDDEDG